MVNRKKELIKNTGILFLGKACVQCVSYLLLPLYTSVLPTADYGIIDLVVTYASLIAPLITIQIETAIFRFLVENRGSDIQRKKIITTSLIFILYMSIICSVFIIIVSLVVNINYVPYLILMVISMICSNTLLQIARGNGSNASYSIASVITAVCTIALNIIFLVVLKTGLVGMFVSTIIANMACSVFLFIREKVYRDIKINLYSKKTLKELLKYSFPFVPNGIIWWIIGVSDRTIVSLAVSVAANGIYSIANKFSNIFIQAYNIYNLSWTETVLLHIDDKDGSRFISKACSEALKLFFSIGIMIVGVMPFIFNLMVDHNYAEAYDYIPLLILASIFNVLVGLVSPVYAARKLTKKIAQTSFMSGVINLVVDVLLINFIGVYAAILSTILSFAIMGIYRYFDVQKYIRIEIPKKTIACMVIGYAACILLYYQKNDILNLILLVGSTVLSVVLCRGMLKTVLTFAKKKLFKKNNK